MIVVQNEALLNRMRTEYSVEQIRGIRDLLESQGTLEFRTLANGLFPAAIADDYTGYNNIWVRDNIHVAHAQLVLGEPARAARAMTALAEFFRKSAHRFEAIIDGTADPGVVMNRPHIRFRGESLEENTEQWAHAQNDALGYFLWLYCRLIRAGEIADHPEDAILFGRFVRYFEKIAYWNDEDSGHWEETRKVEASSIGTVVRGLEELQTLVRESELTLVCQGRPVAASELNALIHQGRTALNQILPWECRQPDPAQRRESDAALLFLIYPLEVIDEPHADAVIRNVKRDLMGPYGIRRYLGDSYWCSDYKDKLDESHRTTDYSETTAQRDALLEPGAEAQWCIFDPILSIIHGQRFAQSGDPEQLLQQVFHFNRSLGQISAPGLETPAWRCPESYYRVHGNYVPNDITPLLWTQANLAMALQFMEQSAQLR